MAATFSFDLIYNENSMKIFNFNTSLSKKELKFSIAVSMENIIFSHFVGKLEVEKCR
jgi:hypothetical protein